MKETLAVVLLIIIVISGLFFMSRNRTNITTFVTGLLALTSKTQLSVRDTSLQFHFEEPCFVTIGGTVENIGDADARDIVVNCFIQDKDKNPLGAESDYLGDLTSGSVRNFLIRINTICTRDIPVYDCRAECGNC